MKHRHRKHARRLRVEPLEDRRMLATIVVDSLEDNTTPDGLITLREAILAANTDTIADVVEGVQGGSGGDSIEFDPALFAEGARTILLTEGELQVTSSLTINGPGAELLTIDASGNDPTPDEKLGDGSRIFNVDDGANATLQTASIRGLALTGGDSQFQGGGGAVRNTESLTIANAVIYGNNASGVGRGGGILSNGGALLVEDSLLFDNRGLDGGGIGADDNAEVSIIRSEFRDNIAWARQGGGIFAISTDLRIAQSQFKGNFGTSGGGVFAAGGVQPFRKGHVSIIESGFLDNTATSASGLGGGVALQSEFHIVSVSDSEFIDNKAANAAGLNISLGFEAEGRIENSLFAFNEAVNVAGGLRVGASQLAVVTLSNITVTENRAGQYAGGILASTGYSGYGPLGPTVTVSNATITGNIVETVTEATNGGGLVASAFDLGSMVVRNSIISGNLKDASPSDLSLVYEGNGTIGLEYNLIGDNVGTSLFEAPAGFPDANGNLIGGPINGAIDPLLGPLANNGGPTLTHALLPGSPALDAGNPTSMAGIGGIPDFDQRGAPWTRVDGGRIDIGALESQPNPLPGDYNFDGVVNAADYVRWRDTLGSATYLQADGDASDVVDGPDHSVWMDNFGHSTESEAAASSAVPVAPQVQSFASGLGDGSSSNGANFSRGGSDRRDELLLLALGVFDEDGDDSGDAARQAFDLNTDPDGDEELVDIVLAEWGEL